MINKLKTFFIKKETNPRKSIDLIRSAYTDRIISKDNAVKNLWNIHDHCRDKTLRKYILKVIKMIDSI